MIRQIFKCLDKNGKWSSKKEECFKKDNYDTYKRIYDFLWCIYRENGLSLNEMYILFTQDIFHPIRCKNSKSVNITHLRKGNNRTKQFGFSLFCCIDCLNTSLYRKEKTKSTCDKVYGGIGFASDFHIKKACKTMNDRYGKPFYVETEEFKNKRISTYIEKYGVDSPMKSEKIKQNHRISMISNNGIDNCFSNGEIRDRILSTIERKYGNKQIMATTYIRNIKESNNEWVPLDKKTDYQLYCRSVDRYTRQSIKEGKIENIEKIKRGMFSLDHIFSKLQGFINNIPPYIVGSHINLAVIPHKENSSKGGQCGITAERLFNMYFSIL